MHTARPRYRKKHALHLSELSVGEVRVHGDTFNPVSMESPGMIMPSIEPSRSVKRTIQEVKMVQVWGNMMRSLEIRTKELLDANVLTPADLYEWLKAKNSHEAPIVGVGLPSYSFLHTLVASIKAGDGILLLDDVVITYENRPQDRLLDWFFHPVMVLKDQIKSLKLGEGEMRYLERVVLFGSNPQRMEAWENGCVIPQDPLMAAQILGISRRLTGMVKSMSKLPIYRRRYRHLVKALLSDKEGSIKFDSLRSVTSVEIV